MAKAAPSTRTVSWRPTTATLKRRHRELRDAQPENWRVRIHRALSWLQRAEREPDDDDARFLFLWIALNAAYAREFGFEQSERKQARQFIDYLVARDRDGRLHQVLFEQFTGPVRTLLENRYVFEPFWRALRDHDSSNAWKHKFDHARALAMRALIEHRTGHVLSTVADRLYVLRNQIVHGGATWKGAANRQQVRDAATILGALMPVIVDLMIENPDPDFEAITYPLVGGRG